MRKRAWGAICAVWGCMAVAGCGEADDHEREELSAQDDGLRPRDAGRGPSGKDAGSVSDNPRDPQPACGPEADGGAENPCHLIDCGPGQRCELEMVQCVRAPCPPVATCVPIDPVHDAGTPGCAAVLCRTGTICKESANGPECVPIATCAATTCLVGSHCIETPTGAECVPAASCAATLCPTGTNCVETPAGAECVPVASCAVTLCPAGTNCVEAPTGAECVPIATCASTLCMTGTNCVDTPSGAQCVPSVTCASTLCITGTQCVDTPTGPQCVPSGRCNLACSKGTHCELEAVACFAAPCPASPACVPNVDACAAVRCKAGTHCELEEVQCIRAPCDPIAACVAD